MAGGRRDQLLRRAGEPDLPVVDDHDLVAHRLHILDDVGGEEHQPLLGGAGEEVAEVDALLRVQPHCGLIKDQERRIPQQGLGDAHPLALSAGEGADLRPGLLLQIDSPDHIPDGRLGTAQTLEGGHVVQKLRDSQLLKEAEVLGQVAEAGLQFPLNLV